MPWWPTYCICSPSPVSWAPRWVNCFVPTPATNLLAQCDLWYKIVGALSILGRAAVITVFSLQTYAVYGQNKWILAYMGTVGLACVALDVTHVPGMRCVGSSSLHIGPSRLVRAGGLKYQRHGIMIILFERGILYFCAISIFTTTAVILNYRAPVSTPSPDQRNSNTNQPEFLQRLPNAFTLPLSCVLTARFILHLRDWEAEGMGNKGRATDLTLVGAVVAVEDFGADPMALGAMGRGEKATK
ncbi:hypothetical protein MVEN_00479100 [Mycena venus]|uniref:Uncharacterized protein n=1 Tax=Mycena venus TaxID=2733690 RepID=A0A8H6YWD3_9AGAR|nr:hypothetical protein MVEN_00479100 [Mycena venus]